MLTRFLLGAGLASFAIVGAAMAADCPVKAPPGLVTDGTLTIGTVSGAAPMAYYDDKGQPAGFDVDFAGAMAKQMCLKPQFIVIDQAGLIPGLLAKKTDVIIGSLGITPQRLEVMNMKPYFVAGVAIVSLKSKNLAFKNEYELCGHTVGTVVGVTATANLERISKDKCPADKKITLLYYQNGNEVIQQARKGVVDAIMPSWTEAAHMTKLMPELAIASPLLSGDPERPRNKAGIAYRKADSAMTEALDQGLQSMIKAGEYDALLKKWDLSGGDIRPAK